MFAPAADDDSSAASSGDEMLNMDISFSQNSTGAIRPKKASAEDSDSSDAGGVGSGKKGGPQDAAKLLSGKKRAHDELAIGIDGESEMEEKARVSAKKAFIIAYGYTKIGGPDKLFWLDRTKNYKKIISPVRMVSREETVGLHLKELNPESQCPIQFIEYPHHNSSGQYAIASRRDLSAYYGKGEDRKQWCPIKLGQYSKQLKENQRLTEEFYLQCALERSLEEGEQEKKLAEFDEAMPEEITTSDLMM